MAADAEKKSDMSRSDSLLDTGADKLAESGELSGLSRDVAIEGAIGMASGYSTLDTADDMTALSEIAEAKGVRVVLLRTGIVMAAEGGALKKQLLPFKLGVGGPLGGGRQWVSWVHIDDVAGLIVHAAGTDVAGPLNVVAPDPVRQADFAKALGRAVGRPAVLPTPGIALRLAMGEMSTLALDGQRVVPQRALAEGYRFAHTDLDEALRDVVR